MQINSSCAVAILRNENQPPTQRLTLPAVGSGFLYVEVMGDPSITVARVGITWGGWTKCLEGLWWSTWIGTGLSSEADLSRAILRFEDRKGDRVPLQLSGTWCRFRSAWYCGDKNATFKSDNGDSVGVVGV